MTAYLFWPVTLSPIASRRYLTWIFYFLPFAAIILFFQISAVYRLFAVPISEHLVTGDLMGLAFPLIAAKLSVPAIGFYHVPMACLLMGFAMMLAARRWAIMAILAAGVILAFSPPVFSVAPLLWFAIPLLCCSFFAGEGMQAIVLAGPADTKWLLGCTAVLAVLSAMSALLGTKYGQGLYALAPQYSTLFTSSARMYLLATAAVGLIAFITHLKLRLSSLRLLVLSAALAIDIVFSTRFIVDILF